MTAWLSQVEVGGLRQCVSLIFSFLAAFVFFLSSFQKGFKILHFSALAPRSGFGAGFGQEKLLSCQRNSFGFCNLVLGNCNGVAAPQMLLQARCLQIVLEWLHQCCSICYSAHSYMVFYNLLLANCIGMVAPKLRPLVFDDFSRFWRFPFSFYLCF